MCINYLSYETKVIEICRYSIVFSYVIWHNINIHTYVESKLIVTMKIEIEDNSYKMEMVNKSYTNGILPR